MSDDQDAPIIHVHLRVRPRWRRVLRVPRVVLAYHREVGLGWWMSLRLAVQCVVYTVPPVIVRIESSEAS